MIGAIIGDIVGSRFEFNNIKKKEFDLFTPKNYFTDDTVLTIAVDEICVNGWYNNSKKIVETFKKWGHKYPYAGYGSTFIRWLKSDSTEPYYSCGNGSAMRISAVGWYANSEEEVKAMSKAVTQVTHNHPEGIKGAEVTAMCIYYARCGLRKEQIKKYVERYYDINFDYDELRRTYIHAEEICQNTVPQAIWCFLNSDSFEDCLRTTISIGGDCDTTAAISCAIAEAYYGFDENNGISDEMFYLALSYLTPEMKEVLKQVYKF